MAGVLADDWITVIEERAARVTATDKGVTTVTRSGRWVTAARVLLATGRQPVTDGLDLHAAGVQIDDRGFVIIDMHQQTSNPRAYAAVDVAGTPQFVYVAAASGRVAAGNALNAEDVPRALVARDTRGAVKLVTEAETGKVLGVHAPADGAGEIMLVATYAIRAGMTVDDIADTWAPYLTMAESLRIAAGLFREERPTSCCA